MTTFDPYDQESWFFGRLTRNEAVDILEREREKGVFLVRYSHSMAGDLVLSVSEENKISHYIINKTSETNGESKFKIGDNTFHDMPTLLTYYKHHYLDTTALIRAAKKRLEYVRAKFDFLGKDKEDLPFKKNEILTIIVKDEEQWWRAKNERGDVGIIPVPYVELIDEEEYLSEKNKDTIDGKDQENGHCLLDQNNIADGDSLSVPAAADTSSASNNNRLSGPDLSSSLSNDSYLDGNDQPSSLNNNHHQNNQLETANNKQPQRSVSSNLNRTLPAKAIVIQQRIPNAYDKKALKLEKGDIITVTNTNLNGQWEGELNGKKGHFPFNYIKFLDDDTTS